MIFVTHFEVEEAANNNFNNNCDIRIGEVCNGSYEERKSFKIVWNKITR